MTRVLDPLQSAAALSIRFQPIFDIRRDSFGVWAVEALTRGPAGTHFEPASIFFEYVRLRHEEVRVDRWCIGNACATLAGSGMDARLSLNVHASTLERDPGFAAFLESVAVSTSIDPSRLILELVEHSPYFDSARTQAAVRDVRALGIGIAIDDVGLGHGNFRTILDAQPEYLKLDRYFVSGAAGDPRRRSLIATTVRMAADFGAMTIGEGVEDPQDLAVLRDLGVPLAQGYLLGLPDETPNLAPLSAVDFLPRRVG